MSKTITKRVWDPITQGFIKPPEPAQGHTPGPWQFVGHFDAVEVSVSDKSIAAWDGADWEIDSELEANARLIAAAPDLLVACKAALAALASYGHESPAARQARAAIAKAEGRAQ